MRPSPERKRKRIKRKKRVKTNLLGRSGTVQPFPLQYTYVTVLDTPPVIESPHKALGMIFGMCARICSTERGGVNPSITQVGPRNYCRWDSAPPRTQRVSSVIVSVAVVVVADHYSSFVPDFDHLCNASDPRVRSCIAWRGGVFSPGKSDTWRKDGGDQPYNGSASNEGWDYLNAENYKGLRPPQELRVLFLTLVASDRRRPHCFLPEGLGHR